MLGRSLTGVVSYSSVLTDGWPQPITSQGFQQGQINRDNLAIVRGTGVYDQAYSDKRRDLRVDGVIALDVPDSGEILEVKPSSSITEPARFQLLFYLWYLDRVTGVKKTGVLAHPTEKRRETVELTPETSAEVVRKVSVGPIDGQSKRRTGVLHPGREAATRAERHVDCRVGVFNVCPKRVRRDLCIAVGTTHAWRHVHLPPCYDVFTRWYSGFQTG